MQLKNAELFRQQAYLDGEWADADGGARFAVANPADGKVIGTVPDMRAAETRRAIAAAHKAFSLWRDRTAKERADILKHWFKLILQNEEDLARLMTIEQGKPLTESRNEIRYAASFIEW